MLRKSSVLLSRAVPAVRLGPSGIRIEFGEEARLFGAGSGRVEEAVVARFDYVHYLTRQTKLEPTFSVRHMETGVFVA